MSYSDEILNQLKKTPSFKPICAETFGDWSIEAGDILTIESEGQIHTLPVFSSEMDWKGSARTTLTASGNSKREVQKRSEREEYGYQQSVRRSMGGLGGQIEGIQEDYVELVARVEDAEAGIAARVLIDDLNGYKEAVANTYATIEGMTAGLNSKVSSSDFGAFKQAVTETYATIADVTAGLEARATVDDLNGYKEAVANTYATIEGMTAGLSTKVETSKLGDYLTKKAASELYVTDDDVTAAIGVYVVSSNGQTKTFAKILADQIDLESDLTTMNDVLANKITADDVNATLVQSRISQMATLFVDNALSVSGRSYMQDVSTSDLAVGGKFSLNAQTVSATKMNLVTDFTQASTPGWTATPVSMSLLTTRVGSTIASTPEAGSKVVLN